MSDTNDAIEELDLDEGLDIATPGEVSDELEVAEELEVEEVAEAPKPKRTRKSATPKADAPEKAPASEFTSAWLARTVTEQTGKDLDARGLRVVLRKLAKDGVIQREVGTDRTRYDFSGGLENATVKAVIEAVRTGADKPAKVAEATTEAPAKKAASRKAAPKATDGETTPTRRRRPKAAPEA